MEGQALFDLSQLLAYRRGQYDPCLSLEKVNKIDELFLHQFYIFKVFFFLGKVGA